MNKVIIKGRLGNDPEVRYTGTGTPVASFDVATDESYTKDGEKIEKMIESANMAEREKRKCLVYLLKRHTPLTLNEIALRVDGNVGYSGISKLVSRFEIELKNNSKLSAIVREFEEKMSKVKT